jgi:archaemetzincin
MRIILGAGVLLLAWCGLARGGADPYSLYRPQAAVESDPPAWYSAALHSPMPKPGPGDWMAAHPEPPQSFEEYVRSKPVRPTQGRHTLYLCPLGQMSAADRARLDVLREFLEVFYALPAAVSVPSKLGGVTSRERSMFGRTVRQYLTGDILRSILRPSLPRDALCLLGVTMEDLYPEESWNYVFGQASLADRVGVYSLVRFYPAFWGQKETPEGERKGLKRSLATLVHETGHMFGVQHCQKYECVMNGSNSLDESDRRPIHLCPPCLKAFRWNSGFDVVARYEGLRKFYAAHDMAAEAAWVEKRIQECRAAPPGGKGPDLRK